MDSINKVIDILKCTNGAKGYITEDDISDACDDYDIPLSQTNLIIDKLMSTGIEIKNIKDKPLVDKTKSKVTKSKIKENKLENDYKKNHLTKDSCDDILSQKRKSIYSVYGRDSETIPSGKIKSVVTTFDDSETITREKRKEIDRVNQKLENGVTDSMHNSSMISGDPEVDLSPIDSIQFQMEKDASELSVDYNNYDRFINLDLSKGDIVEGIPCGIGNNDYGFIIHGTKYENKKNQNEFSSIQAIIFNFLTRNTRISKDFFSIRISKFNYNYELNPGNIYRYLMLLVDLMEPTGETVLRLHTTGDINELHAAENILNDYLEVFCRLTKSELCSVTVIDDKKGKSISVENPADYYTENIQKDVGLRRRIRYGRRINYSLDERDRKDMEYILSEISPFTSFRKGQFEALCSMLNNKGHSVCIMPTGSGKSLIYYLASILQPQVVFVVSPTDILIKDQIRNLKKFHNFDSVSHLILREDNDFSFFRPATNLVFLTPSTFQNRNLFGSFVRLKNEIAYVVLDEIHCMSTWSHDFRPEYLMLSKNLNKYLDNAKYLGFTATANYTVAVDIQKQLNISENNFFSPVLFEKYNVKYDFIQVFDMDDMLVQVKKISDEIIHRGERAIVFTKNDSISRQVADAIGYEADVFTSDRPESYIQFAEGLCNILVASKELGVGINLPDVTCTVHFGLPLSKNEFVQEIGRAGRANERVKSYIIFLEPTELNIPAQLLKRDVDVVNIGKLFKAYDNDYSDVFHTLTNGLNSSDELFEDLKGVYGYFKAQKKVVNTIDYDVRELDFYKKLLYMLFVTGYIKDWYTYKCNNKKNEVQLIVDICSVQSSNHSALYLDDKTMLERMISTSREYFSSMDNDRESIFKVSKSTVIEDVLRVYVEWYYNKFIYHHLEEFLDFFEFVTGNINCESVKITEEIEDYYTLPFVEMKEDSNYYGNMSIEEISSQFQNGIGKKTLANLERVITDSYSYKIDYLLFIGHWLRSGRVEISRLERLWHKLSDDEKDVFFDTLYNLFADFTDESKLSFFKYFEYEDNVFGIGLKIMTERIYSVVPRDRIFYGLMAKTFNEIFESICGGK